MRTRLLLVLVAVASLVCCRASVFAQQTGTTKQAKADQTAEHSDDDLAELESELDGENKSDAKKGDTKQAAVKKKESYAERARRQAMEARDRLIQGDPRWTPTHKQINRIEIQATLNNMCLDSEGHVLACCGDKKIRVFSADGELLDTRTLSFVPEAIAVRKSDGAIFVGGQGQLVRTSANGELEQKVAFPPPPTKEQIEATIKKQLKRYEEQAKRLAVMTQGFREQLDEINEQLAKDEPSDAEKKKTARLSIQNVFSSVKSVKMVDGKQRIVFKENTPLALKARMLETYVKQMSGSVDLERMEKQLRKRLESSAGTSRYTSLAVSDKDLFVICSGAGYAFDAWRMNHDLGELKQVLTGLRGCCGQMDCQTHDGNLWLAMNTEHKVLCYDRDGNEVTRFGKRDANAADGFGGCCEPKNLRFSADGQYVYCAQSGPPVCVKRFTLEGEFQDVVCFPVFETGCVRVSVDTHGDTFFMMSPNERAIYVFAPKEESKES